MKGTRTYHPFQVYGSEKLNVFEISTSLSNKRSHFRLDSMLQAHATFSVVSLKSRRAKMTLLLVIVINVSLKFFFFFFFLIGGREYGRGEVWRGSELLLICTELVYAFGNLPKTQAGINGKLSLPKKRNSFLSPDSGE
jgi:hypothetical protein